MANPDVILGQSEAKVTVYIGDRVLANFSVPTGQQGYEWDVFSMRKSTAGGDPIITPLNDMQTYADSTGQSANYRAALRASSYDGRPGLAMFDKLGPKD